MICNRSSNGLDCIHTNVNTNAKVTSAYNISVILHKYTFKWRIFTCNEVFHSVALVLLIKKNDLNSSSISGCS